MTCFLTKNIKHSCEYDSGGIASIYLLDIRDFISYKFRDDNLFNECYVEEINVGDRYIQLDVVDESNFIESEENGIYKQELSTFIRSLEAGKLRNLLITKSNKYLVVFVTQGKAYSFGSDGGASLSFTQQTGQLGESSGYQIKISKQSVYPLFEVKVSEITKRVKFIIDNSAVVADGIMMRTGVIK